MFAAENGDILGARSLPFSVSEPEANSGINTTTLHVAGGKPSSLVFVAERK
jgi:hypothetical protein